jgi:peptidoglycan hydrolase-like protein with peptidoglycan-binding domain
VVPDVAGKTAGGAHNALISAHLVPTAPSGQQPGQICTATSPGAGSDAKVSSSVTISAATAPTLQMNASGSWVTLAQKDLNRANAGLAVDSSFGAATQAAVEHFQGNHGLTSDGIVGPATWGKLGSL